MLKSRLVPQKDTEDPELPIGVEFGAKVRAARKARGWNAQRELAMRCDPPTTQSTISMIENGHGSSSVVLAVCRVLGLEPPAIVLSEDLRRWLEVGQVILVRNSSLFSATLTSMEQLAAALPDPAHAAPSDDAASVVPGVPSERH